MIIAFGLLAATTVLEILAHIFGASWRARRLFAVFSLITGVLAAGALLLMGWNLPGLLIAIISLYRVFNMMRIIKGRMHERYLRRATRQTSLTLLGLQTIVLLAWVGWNHWQMGNEVAWSAVALLQVTATTLLLLSLLRSLSCTRWPRLRTHYSDRDLPTLTVAIPARNETQDLQECLQSIVASDYPKLEIIVLDDCSQLKRTPEIIKEFAHDGVRFVQGHEPRDTWLPKNQAYDRLASEASGAYILFCGVDVRFAPQSMRLIVSTALKRRKKMINLLPQRRTSAYGRFSLIQAMRYWWELVPPRRLFNRPPVLSSCWLIEVGELKKAGGFAAVARSVVPEAYFARRLVTTDAYSFLRSDNALGVESTKKVNEQSETAVRMRYPQMHRRPEQVALISLAELFFLASPFALALAGFWVTMGTAVHLAAIITSLLLVVIYELTVFASWVNTWWFGLLAAPFSVIADVMLIHYSMWKYEFSRVDWKGRNVCIPVMHVVPNLPASGE